MTGISYEEFITSKNDIAHGFLNQIPLDWQA